MRIIYNPARIGSCALAIGNFDGVHLGHRAIIDKAREVAEGIGYKASVMTFEPHPRMFFQREKAPKRIATFKQKMQLLKDAGVEDCYVMKFNSKFAAIDADDFIARFLRRAHVVTGENFGFGAGRSGDSGKLDEALGARYHTVPALNIDGDVVSSSRIRAALQEGELELANQLLGHKFSVQGKVQHGAKQGAQLGFPTANLRLKPKQLRPKYGVYAVQTNLGAGVANFGVRPSLDGKNELLEVHLFNFAKDIYGEDLQVKFHAYIRPEKHFAGVDELRAQIEKDVNAAKQIFK